MKTTELISLLATSAGPAPRAVAARRLAPAALAGLLASALLVLWVLGPVPSSMLDGAALWTKLAYGSGLLAAGAWWCSRLGRPAAPTAGPLLALAGVAAAMVGLGLLSLLAEAPQDRLPYLLGYSWAMCPFNVLLLSLPALAATLWALRGLAPTQLRRAGLAAGLMAGAAGALGYALGCGETSLSFVALWYSLGMALSAALGALLGPWVLRW